MIGKDFYCLLTLFGTVKDAFRTRLLELIMLGFSFEIRRVVNGTTACNLIAGENKDVRVERS